MASKRFKKIFEISLLLTSISLMTWQVTTCVGKIFDQPTGTSQALLKVDMNTKFMITICTDDIRAKMVQPDSIRVKDFNDDWSIVFSFERNQQV